MTRGVLYMIWPGPVDCEPLLQRSIASVKLWHPELPIHVERLPDGATLLDKAKMNDITPFCQTLYLDADTVVMDRLDYGFDRAERFGMACSICEAPYAARFAGLADRGDLVEYNTGVLFWEVGISRGFMGEFFPSWKRWCGELDSSLTWTERGQWFTMPLNDQAGFAAAMDASRARPFILPMNWNLRPQWQTSWFGKVKVWHAYWDPPQELLDDNASSTPMTRRVGVLHHPGVDAATAVVE